MGKHGTGNQSIERPDLCAFPFQIEPHSRGSVRCLPIERKYGKHCQQPIQFAPPCRWVARPKRAHFELVRHHCRHGQISRAGSLYCLPDLANALEGVNQRIRVKREHLQILSRNVGSISLPQFVRVWKVPVFPAPKQR
jgi:hypothetical protein